MKKVMFEDFFEYNEAIDLMVESRNSDAGGYVSSTIEKEKDGVTLYVDYSVYVERDYKNKTYVLEDATIDSCEAYDEDGEQVSVEINELAFDRACIEYTF